MEKRYKLSVTRSNRYLFAQVVEPGTGRIVFGRSEKALLPKETGKKTKTEKAGLFGVLFGQEAVKMKVVSVYFDRGCYRYHGRIKAFAEGAREAGLKF